MSQVEIGKVKFHFIFWFISVENSDSIFNFDFPLVIFTLFRFSGSCSCSIVFSQVLFWFLIFPFGSISIGRKHFSAGANIFHRAQTFSFLFFPGAKDGRKHFSKTANISQQARTFFTGRKHFLFFSFQAQRMGANISQRPQTFLSRRKHFSKAANISTWVQGFGTRFSKFA